MAWKFDQGPTVTCITCQRVIDGHAVLVVTHYNDDHSWAFLEGQTFHTAEALIVAMSTVLKSHPDLIAIADLPPGWSASRASINDPWIQAQDDFGSDA